jgi:hypothetical protein
MPSPSRRYVACKVSRGVFETELYITFGGSSAYVDRDSVRVEPYPENGDEVPGQVLAYLVTEENDNALVEIPGEPVVGGVRTWVPKSQVVSA